MTGLYHHFVVLSKLSAKAYNPFNPSGLFVPTSFRHFKYRISGTNSFDNCKVSIQTIFHRSSVHRHFLRFRPERQVNIRSCVCRNSQIHCSSEMGPSSWST